MAVVVDDQGRRRSPAARAAARRTGAWRTAAPARRPGRASARRGCGSRTARGGASDGAGRGTFEYGYPRLGASYVQEFRRSVAAAPRAPRPGSVDRDRELEAGDLEHPADLVVVAADDDPAARRSSPPSRRCQARTIRAIPVESMNSHSERSISTEPSPLSSGLLERALQIGGGAEVELAADRDRPNAVARDLGGGYLERGWIHAPMLPQAGRMTARQLGFAPTGAGVSRLRSRGGKLCSPPSGRSSARRSWGQAGTLNTVNQRSIGAADVPSCPGRERGGRPPRPGRAWPSGSGWTRPRSPT